MTVRSRPVDKALDLDPDNAVILNSRGLAYFNARARTTARWPTTISPCRSGRIIGAYQQSRPHLSAPAASCSAPTTNSTSRCRSTPATTATSICSISAACRRCASNTTSALTYFAEGKPLDAGRLADRRATAASPMPRWAASTRRLPIATRCSRSIRSLPARWSRRGNVYRVKGDLDAALRDYNDALKLSPNFVHGYVGRGQVYEARKDLAAARADYRSAGAALTKFDELRDRAGTALCQERLAALVAADPSLRASRGAGGAATRQADLVIVAGGCGDTQGRADRRQWRLQKRACARQSAARRKTDRGDPARSRLPDRQPRAGSHPRPVLRRAARLRPRGREGGLGRGLLCRPRHGDRRHQLSDSDRRQTCRRP